MIEENLLMISIFRLKSRLFSINKCEQQRKLVKTEKFKFIYSIF